MEGLHWSTGNPGTTGVRIFHVVGDISAANEGGQPDPHFWDILLLPDGKTMDSDDFATMLPLKVDDVILKRIERDPEITSISSSPLMAVWLYLGGTLKKSDLEASEEGVESIATKITLAGRELQLVIYKEPAYFLALLDKDDYIRWSFQGPAAK